MKKKNIYILGTLIGCFIILLTLILTGKIEAFDTLIYNIITLVKNDKVTSIYKCITFFGSTRFIVILCLLFLLIFWKQKRGFLVSVCLIISTIINNVLKIIIRRERPLSLMMVEESTFSFPSGHTMASVSMYGFLIYLVWKSNYFCKKTKIILTILLSILTLAIAASRIYLGAHYASDIIGAILVSSIWLLIFINFIENKKII